MPDVSDLFSEIIDHGYDDVSDTRKLAVINASYWDVCGRQPWPFLEKTVALTFNGTSSAPAGATPTPTDFHAVTAMSYNTDGGNAIKHERYQNYLRYHVGDTTTGIPVMYYFDKAGDLNFWPIPTSDVQVQMQYISTPVALTATDTESTIVIPKQFQRDTLVNGAVYRLAGMEDDTDVAAFFKAEYEQTIGQMDDWMNRRQYTNPDIILPTQDDMDYSDGTWGWWYN